ncbi:MAG: PEP-CTERM sorting domain-containing protein, partial [Phycisphaeraceae bacterium]|nr:PEP-CTERM sorting domain-containing protein [Phycisphaeraceae bacterium]
GEVDPNQSGVINVQDINTFVALLAGSGVDSAQLAAIPEPASLSLLALGGLTLLRRER